MVIGVLIGLLFIGVVALWWVLDRMEDGLDNFHDVWEDEDTLD